MSLFAKVPLDAARWMLRNVVHESTPPDAVCILELTTALVAGDLPSWSQREWGRRWKCSTYKVRRIVEMVAKQYPNTNQTGTEHYPNTLRQCFPHLRALEQTETERKPNTDQTTCARSSQREREEEKRENQGPLSDPAGESPEPAVSKSETAPTPEPAPAPKPPSEAEQGLEVLRTVRLEHHRQVMGVKPRGSAWSKGNSRTGMLAKVKRFLAEVKSEELGEPLEVLRLSARWSYLAPDAAWMRDPGCEPLEYLVGGRKSDPAGRLKRVRKSLAWAEGKSPPPRSSGRPAPRSSDPVAALLREMEAEEASTRVVVNPTGPPTPAETDSPFTHPAPGFWQ